LAGSSLSLVWLSSFAVPPILEGKTMSNEIERLLDFRKLHEGIVREINRTPVPQESGAQGLPQHAKPEDIAVSRDIAPYLACVESAAKMLEQTKSHARDMEAAVDDLQQRQMELETSLDEAKYRNTQLEESFAAERNRAARAQTLAGQAAKRIEELETALADANARADALTSAIEKAFADVVERPNSGTAAA
jgi:predicted RNase H-like nuclease (RuvC/YqgF family)